MQDNNFLYTAQEWQESMIADFEFVSNQVFKRGKIFKCEIAQIEKEQFLDDFK